MKPSPLSARLQLWLQFVVGLGYFSLVAAIVSEFTDYPYFLVWPGVFAAVAVCAALALTWATLWARRDDGRLGQFGIGSLLFLTVFAAMFFGSVRWIADTVRQLSPNSYRHTNFGLAAIAVLLMVLISIPFAVLLTESVIWLGVWILRRPTVRWLRGKK